MSIAPVASFLVDFGSSEPVAANADEPLPSAVIGVGEDEDAKAEQIEAAYARGLEEARAAAEAELEARLAEQKASAEQEIAAAREQWCSEEGARIAEQITAAIGDLEESVAQSAEHILRPFLVQAVREQAVAGLRASLQELFSTNAGVELVVSGPEDLLSAVRASLPAPAAAASYVINDACEVQIKAGAAIIETRIGEWLKQLEGPSQ